MKSNLKQSNLVSYGWAWWCSRFEMLCNWLDGIEKIFFIIFFGCLVDVDGYLAHSWLRSDDNKNKLYTYASCMHLSIVEYLPRYCIPSICRVCNTMHTGIQAFKQSYSGICFVYSMYRSYNGTNISFLRWNESFSLPWHFHHHFISIKITTTTALIPLRSTNSTVQQTTTDKSKPSKHLNLI